jgi:hypothetical protein
MSSRILARRAGVAAFFALLPALARATPTKTERETLPIRLELAEAHGREGRIRMTVETDPILDFLFEKGEGRLRTKIFTGSAATRVFNSTADLSVPFDASIDEWVVDLPLHWSSQDTWVAVEVVETRSGARGQARMELSPNPVSRALEEKPPPPELLRMTLRLSDVKRTSFQSTGSLHLTISTAEIARAYPGGLKGRARVVVLEKTGSGALLSIPAHTTFPFSADSEDWSTSLKIRWSELASLLAVEVTVKETGFRAEGSIPVNGAD